MTYKGLKAAVDAATDRANRTKEAICVVQVGQDEYVLWRAVNKAAIPYVYTHYKIIQVIKIKYDTR